MWLKLGQEIGKKLHETANLRLYMSGVMNFLTLFGDLRLTLNEFFNFLLIRIRIHHVVVEEHTG